VFWPDLDVHLGWEQFLQAADREELLRSKQRTEGYNRRYGAAIRRLRQKSNLSQSSIEGLEQRQVRRIEQGENRVTSKALASLAKAHGLEVSTYMEMVAQEME
jgi:hypothetical protein